ncbi:MAG: N-acetylmuramoyl-L-alanine amidase [Candidatus Polarisedimenticolaceae bacterium]|nr:N-acetylmuramoyl-L-alanine amidase [Candidatus Polarisedimenticolaceae bacterium]
MRKITLLLLLLWNLPLLAQQVEISGMRIWSAPDHVRLVFDTSSQLSHNLFQLKNPQRLVLDLNSATLKGVVPKLERNNLLIKRLRVAERGKNSLRVVLDLKEAIRPKSFVLKPNDKYGHRLVLDLFQSKKVAVSRSHRPVKTVGDKKLRDIVVAIDAGHGGEDPGAKGHSGTYEKDVVLAISRKLAALVNKEPGMRAVLTRDGDYFLPLRKRMAKARDARADLFISIHADAFRDARVRGASVYTLSRSGATSEAAAFLAKKENSSDMIGGVTLDDKDDVLVSVLLDLSQNATLQASSEAAGFLLKQLKKVGKTHKPRVQQARFVVLKSPDVPSVLVETAFISNRQEERRLKSNKHQTKMARALMQGIRNYFAYLPPPGTLLAARATRTHTINAGETLSAIAVRYQVSLNQLKRANRLKGSNIRVGQVLDIPTI